MRPYVGITGLDHDGAALHLTFHTAEVFGKQMGFWSQAVSIHNTKNPVFLPMILIGWQHLINVQ